MYAQPTMKPASRISLLAAILALACAFATGCGGQSQDEIESARANAALEQKLSDQAAERERKLTSETAETIPAPSSSGSSAQLPGQQCNATVSAGANTTCPFALNVASQYNGAGSNTPFSAYSPATRREYTMSCSSGSPVVCTGGNNATVYIRR
jgi:hypothetical protein